MVENPTFMTRRGLPTEWFYEGGLDRWTARALRVLRPEIKSYRSWILDPR
jgi:hypothetical protein